MVAFIYASEALSGSMTPHSDDEDLIGALI